MDPLSHIHMSSVRYHNTRQTYQQLIAKWENMPDRKGARLDTLRELRDLELRYEKTLAKPREYKSVIWGIL